MNELFSEHYTIYQKIKYTCSILILTGLMLFKVITSKFLAITAISVLIICYIINELLIKVNYSKNSSLITIFRFIELCIYNAFDCLLPHNGIFMSLWTVIIIFTGIMYIIESSEFDKTTISTRKLLFFIPLLLKTFLTFKNFSLSSWVCYCLIQAIISGFIFMLIDAYLHLNDTYESIKRKLIIEKSNIESSNEKLLDYQEKVKTINEQINYQKIDLAKTLRELEQVQIETKSQTEIMKYMASTFDVLKCMNVIADYIMDIKKPKLCAFYVDKNVYQNKYSSCIIKTNYTSMQRRLKKDIDKIFESIAKDFECAKKIYKDGLKNKFKFISDANINSLAFFPIIDKKRIYGLLLVGSDEENFFDKDTSYYENCIIEFAAAMKSTKLYLNMEDMARKDGLTGIYNRIYNADLFKKVSKEALSKNKPLTVGLFDIDKFKNVNDTYGHLVGDDVIKMVAEIAKKYAEEYNGFACRFGGEEFLLTLPDYDEQNSITIFENMHSDIRSTSVKAGANNINIDVCIGISSYPNLCTDPELLVSRADKAMYYGKKHGRGRIIIDNPEIDEEISMEN